jgi:hypothetical protein
MKAQFSDAEIKKTLEEFAKKKDEEIYAILDYNARDFVSRCKTGGSYTDRTGNLRSSIGYLILKDGNEMSKHCEGGTEDGTKGGLEYAEELAGHYNRGWVLIVFAGMNYALYVELKGFSVITSFLPDQNEFIQKLAEILHE